MTLRIRFAREAPRAAAERRRWLLEELGASLFVLAALALLVLGILPVRVALCWYATVAGIAFLNMVRAIGATHRYRSGERPVGFDEQVEDSVNVESRRLTTLVLCPVGVRYHALHHLFPSLPYHALGRAHRRLREVLPPDSAYHRCTISGVRAGWRQLWGEIRRASARGDRGLAMTPVGVDSRMGPRSDPTRAG